MPLSRELQAGKAGEHFVCYDLIMQGYNAFLADQGLPFDVVVEKDGALATIQVKSTHGLRSYGAKATDIYRFGTRRGAQCNTRVSRVDVDFFAFVALDSMLVAYVPMEKMVARTGSIKQTMDFKTRAVNYVGRVYPNGTVRTPEWGKYIEDYREFSIGEEE